MRLGTLLNLKVSISEDDIGFDLTAWDTRHFLILSTVNKTLKIKASTQKML